MQLCCQHRSGCCRTGSLRGPAYAHTHSLHPSIACGHGACAHGACGLWASSVRASEPNPTTCVYVMQEWASLNECAKARLPEVRGTVTICPGHLQDGAITLVTDKIGIIPATTTVLGRYTGWDKGRHTAVYGGGDACRDQKYLDPRWVSVPRSTYVQLRCSTQVSVTVMIGRV